MRCLKVAALGEKSIGGILEDFSAADGDGAVRLRRVYRLLGPLGIADRVRQDARDVMDDGGDSKQTLAGFTVSMIVDEQYMTAAARPG